MPFRRWFGVIGLGLQLALLVRPGCSQQQAIPAAPMPTMEYSGHGAIARLRTPASATAIDRVSAFGRNGYILEGVSHTLHVNEPGFSHGNDQLSPQQGWSTLTGSALHLVYRGEGIHGGFTSDTTCSGTGDCNNYQYLFCYGGRTAASDEGCQPFAVGGGEASEAYSGVLAGGAPGAETIRVLCDRDCDHPGDGRFVGESFSPAQRDVITGYVRNGGPTPSELTVLGSVPISSLWGTLAEPVLTQNPDAPADLSTWDRKMVTVKVLGGAGAKVGELACFGGNYSDTGRIEAVDGDGTTQTLTLRLRQSHAAGTWVMTGGLCGRGIDLDANVVDGLHYPEAVLGATGLHTVRAQVPQLGTQERFLMGNATNATLNQEVGVSSVSRRGAVVSLILRQPFAGWNDRWMNGVTISLRGSPGGALDGTCRASRLSTSRLLQCDMPGADASDPQGSSVVTLGETGYGNTGFEWLAMAEVVDVRDLSQPASSTDAQGDLQEPQIDGTLHLVPNLLPNLAGARVTEYHHPMLQVQGATITVAVHNPFEGLPHAGLSLNVYGAGTPLVPVARFTNDLKPGGLGQPGLQFGSPMAGYLEAAFSPTYANPAVHIGCPPTAQGCADAAFRYSAWRLEGDRSRVDTEYQPATSVLTTLNRSAGSIAGESSLMQSAQWLRLAATDYRNRHSLEVTATGVAVDGSPVCTAANGFCAANGAAAGQQGITDMLHLSPTCAVKVEHGLIVGKTGC